MATRFYLASSSEVNEVETTAISPAPDSAWNDITQVRRFRMRDYVYGYSLPISWSFTDTDATNKKVLIAQFISDPFVATQTIFGNDPEFSILAFVQTRAYATQSNSFLRLAGGLRVLASNGTTVRKTICAVSTYPTSHVVAGDASRNQHWDAATTAGNYTTQAGDRLVLELGFGGDPNPGSSHSGSLTFMGSAGSDLLNDPDDISTQSLNSWCELVDDLTFIRQNTVIRGKTTIMGKTTIY